MRSMHQKIVVLLVLAVLLVTSVGVVGAAPHNTVDIQILNVSDWHGQLDPISGVGGAAVLSAYFKVDRLANPNTLTLTAGDAVGATPPISSFFQDTPTIQAMNLMGFQVDTFGNHNFDAGISRLQSQINMATFPYVSANLTNRDDNLTGVKDYQIFDVGGIKVGVIGITNPEAPTLVFPGSFGTIVPSEPVKAAIQARGAAKEAGAQVIVVIAHMGVTGFNLDGSPFGPLIDFARAVNPENNKNQKVDVIIGDHTDIKFSGIINGALVYENKSKGVTYAKAHLTVDAENGKILSQSVDFVSPVASAVTPDPAIVALLAPYRTQLAPIFSNVIGNSTRYIPRADACGTGNGRTCESLVGNVTTDSMRAKYSSIGVDFALTNSGGLRADLTCPTIDSPSDFCPSYAPPLFPISRGQVLGVLPFGNIVVTLTVNGAELKTMLENGVSKMPAIDGRFPQVSGLCVTYDIAAAVGSRVTGAVRQATDGSCTGAAVDLTTASTYKIAENDFMAAGGDGYPVFTSRMTTQDIMDQVLADYISAQGTVAPAIQGRINCTDGNGATAPNCPVVVP